MIFYYYFIKGKSETPRTKYFFLFFRKDEVNVFI